MLSLIRIRVKYLIRNPCLLFWSYIFLPLIIFIVGIYMIVDRKNDNKLERKRKAYVLETMNFLNNSNYKYLSRYGIVLYL